VFGWLTQLAFVLLIALVVARVTMSETLREPFDVATVPGQAAPPRGAGATTSLVLDLLCCVPAMLILLRRGLDREYVVRFTIAEALLLAFAIFAALSALWSADQFAAAVTAAHLLAAAAVFWAAAQLVRSWLRLRLIAGICFGLLLVYTAHGLIFEFVDVPDNIKYWQEHREQELRARGFEPDSFAARMFEQKLLRGELVGFTASPNTHAAVMVLLGIVSAGVVVQRFRDGDEWGWPTAVLLAMPFAVWVLWYTQSKTALATPILAALLLLALAWLRPWIAPRRSLVFAACVTALVLVVLAVVGHGLWHHSLPSASLNFRWKYWVGAERVFAMHPLIGVGWSNFGSHYLSVRLPEAAEEVRDPHNLFVRAFVELGLIGGALLVAWLVRLWWELTTPNVPPTPPSREPQRELVQRDGRFVAFNTLVGLALLAMAINAIASIDWNQNADFILLELLRRLLYAGLLMLGFAVVALRSSQQPVLDDRPAPWVLDAMLVGLGMFLVHNLIDFSLFETGPMLLFMLIAGTVAGVRAPSLAGQRKRTLAAIAALGAVTAAWLTAAIGFVVPLAQAESRAADADQALRNRNPELAASLFRAALASAPVKNADYAYRAAQAFIVLGDEPNARAMLAQTIAMNPLDFGYPLARANFLRSLNVAGNFEQIRADYARALELNPNDVKTRIDYADVLADAGQREPALEQYRIALAKNDQLDPAEPKRLEHVDPKKRADLERKIREFGG
jgi:O-antigen ligase/tetratricopeptide (TPR) repeat protein